MSEDNKASASKGANVKVPPPLVFGGAVAAAILLSWLIPWSLRPSTVRWLLGIVAMGGGVGLGAWALQVMLRAGHHPNPWTPSPTLIRTGPYLWTRNPMYLGMTMVVVGLGFVLGSPYLVAAGLGAARIVQRVAIEQEEKYLADKFGEAYAAYQKVVGRWF